ncbi:hypothetical protein ScPMuIL_003720 [Solemya velum]
MLISETESRMNAYTSPLFPVDELVSSLNDMNIRCETNDFRHPDASRWQEIFSNLYECLTDVPVDQIIQQHQSGTEELCDFPELHADSLPVLVFTMSMQRVMSACGVHNFTVKDLIDPEPKRVQSLCSALVNYNRFRKDRLDVYYELKEGNEKFQDQYKQLININDELKRKVNKLKAQKAEQQPAISRVQEDLDALQKQMDEHHRQKASMQRTLDEMRSHIAEKQAAVDQMKVAISKAKGEIEKLSLKIVQSPQKVKKEQEDMKQRLVSMKMTLENKQERLSELQKMKQNIMRSEIDAEKALKLLMSIQCDVDKENEIANEISQILDKTQEQKNSIRKLQLHKEQLVMVMESRQDRLAKMTLQHKAKMKEVDERLTQLKLERESQSQDRQAEQTKKTEILNQKRALAEELKRVGQEHDKKIQSIQQMYYEILENVDAYHKSLGLGWEDFRKQIQSEKYT